MANCDLGKWWHLPELSFLRYESSTAPCLERTRFEWETAHIVGPQWLVVVTAGGSRSPQPPCISSAFRNCRRVCCTSACGSCPRCVPRPPCSGGERGPCAWHLALSSGHCAHPGRRLGCGLWAPYTCLLVLWLVDVGWLGELSEGVLCQDWIQIQCTHYGFPVPQFPHCMEGMPLALPAVLAHAYGAQ